MVNVLDMKDIGYLNLFSDITKVQTRFCFSYNNVIIFSVPKALISKAVGKEGRNVKRLNELIRKKIKIISSPRGIEDAKSFISFIVSPITFKDLEIKGDEMILTAGSQSKAALIGRNKRRLIEMQTIVKDYFGKNFKIV